ncbi:MAG: BatA domain-containing protein [Candidatus Zixiibacteriota bacterium]
MFSFLNGSVLFAALAALIPLIIHLFSRRRVKVVDFSSVRHLKAMQKRQVRRLKIRQLLLLLLRMLVILAVVLAFARPTTKSGTVGSHASVAAVVLLDNSASMNRYVTDGNLFDIAKKRTYELLQTFGQADQIVLMPLCRRSEQVTPQAFGSAAVALEQLEQTQVGYGEADFQTTLQSAVDLLTSAAHLNRELYIVSDQQRHSLPDKQLPIDSAARVYVVDLPLEVNDNIGIVSVDFGGQLIQPGLDFSLVATVKNYGPGDGSDMLASLFVDDRRVAQTSFRVGGNAEATVRFTHAVTATGFHSGYVEISDDKFQGDNRYYFSFRIADRFNVLIVNGDQSAQYIGLALAPSPALTQAWSVKTAAPDELSGVDLSGYDVVVLAGAPRLAAPFDERIKSFVMSGKGAFVVYGADSPIGDFNSLWSDMTGVMFDEPVRATFTRAGYYSFQSFTMAHPVFSLFGFEKSKPPEIKFFTLPKPRLVGQSRELAEFTGSRPALVENQFGSGRVITFTAPMIPDYTDLPGQAFFVPFVSRIVEYLASDLSSLETRLFVGGNIIRSPMLRGAPAYSLQMTSPDNMEYSLSPEDSPGAVTVNAKPTQLPGIYSLRYVSQEVDRFAVNLKPAECDLTAADMDQFTSAIGAASANQLTTGAPMEAAIASFRFGRELWQLFLWGAVLFLALEMLLARGAPPEE